MRKAWAVALVAAAVGCGESQRPTAEDPSVVVPAGAPSAVQPAPPEPPQAAPARVPQPELLQTCVSTLRAGDWLASKADPAQRLYEEALRAEQSGDLEHARRTWFTAIQQHPGSAYTPLIYLAFGESFASEAAGDPSKWALARQAWLEVSKYPLPENQAYANAHQRLGQVELREDPAKALAAFKRVLETVRAFPGTPCSSAVAREAEQGLVDSYADAGRPERAGAFFQAAAPDRVVPLSLGLAQALVRRNQVAEGAEVLRLALMREAPAPLCQGARAFLAMPAVSASAAAAKLVETVRSRCAP